MIAMKPPPSDAGNSLLPPQGVPDWAWHRIARSKGKRWAIDERDAQGLVIGTTFRSHDGSKSSKPGGSRGLILEWPLDSYAGSSVNQPIYVCEGASDTAALMGLGLDAVGVPMAGQCAEMLADLLAGLHVVIVVDADKAGREGGEKIARRLVGVCASVRVIEPPVQAKDARAAVIAGANTDAFTTAAQAAKPLSKDSVSSAPPAFVPVSAASLIARYSSLRSTIIAGLLRRGEVMNVVAAPKTGKSWLVHDLAVRVSQGKPWFHWLTTKCKVLIIDGELHPETLSYRLGRVREWSKLGKGVSLDIDVGMLRGRRITIDGIREMLVSVTAGTYGLIILDALYRFMPLDGEENSNETMTEVYNTLDAIAGCTGASIVVVHHSSKGSQAEKSITDVGAGAGAQSRAADTHLILRPHEQEGAVVLDAVARSFTPIKPFVISRDENGWKVESHLDPTKLKKPKSRTKSDASAAAAKPESKVWQPAEFATEVVGKTPDIKAEIIARARGRGISKTDAQDLFNRVCASGMVYEHPTAQNSPKRFACVEPNVFSGVGGGGQGCGPPPAPSADALGGCGGDTHTPPSPPQRALPYAQLEDKPQRKTTRRSTSRRGGT